MCKYTKGADFIDATFGRNSFNILLRKVGLASDSDSLKRSRGNYVNFRVTLEISDNLNWSCGTLLLFLPPLTISASNYHMSPIHSQVERSSASLKRRRASSAPCEDEAIRNSKRSRSDVDRSSIKPFPILGFQGDESLNNEINKIDKGKAKPEPSPEVGCLTSPDMTLSNKSVIEELAAVSPKSIIPIGNTVN